MKVRFEVLIADFWDIMSCSIVKMYWCCRKNYCTFLWNTGTFLPGYMASHCRRQHSSQWINSPFCFFNIHYNINPAVWSGLFLLKLSANTLHTYVFFLLALSLWSILVTIYFLLCLLNGCCPRCFPTKFNVHFLSFQFPKYYCHQNTN